MKNEKFDAILADDKAGGGRAAPLLRCVICRRDTQPSKDDLSLGWWGYPHTIYAAGLCHNNGICSLIAGRSAAFGDWNAEFFLGKNAMLSLDKLLWTYDDWDADALLRLTRIVTALSEVKVSKERYKEIRDRMISWGF